MSNVLGFDVGHRRIGIAVGNRIAASARAVAVAAVHGQTPDWPHIDAVHRAWQPELLVVGLPLRLDGAKQPASRRARRFADDLRQRYGLPVVLVDERHSSQEAAERFAAARAQGLRRRRDAAQLDAVAAAVILERWLLDPACASPDPSEPSRP